MQIIAGDTNTFSKIFSLGKSSIEYKSSLIIVLNSFAKTFLKILLGIIYTNDPYGLNCKYDFSIKA